MNGRILIRGGEVHDGSGRAAQRADVLVEGDRIAAIGAFAPPPDTEILDAEGLVVAPGFIDVHSHSDYTLLVDPRAVSAIHQGVTLEIVGNCGHGCAPRAEAALAPLAIYGPAAMHGMPPGSMAGYLARLEAARPAVNVATLAANGQMRLSAVGLAGRPASPGERASMSAMLRTALEEGAYGLSTGLEYAQELGASEDEVTELAAIAGRAGGIYATHVRNRDEAAVPAIEEAIRTAERAQVPLQISHLTPRSGMDTIDRCIEASLAARRRGNPVHFDMHTRLFGFTHLKNIAPAALLEGSPAQIRARLAEPATRRQLRAHRNIVTRVGFDRVVLASSATRPQLVGLTFVEIGARLGTDPHEAAIDILAADAEDLLFPMVILRTYTEEQLRRTYLAEDCLIGSDATALAPDGPLAGEIFHGAYTWAAWFWRRMVRETRSFTRAEAIRRLSGLPADVFALPERGRIAPGMKADIAIFDPDGFGERGTVESPNLLATGMRHVLVNGVATLRDGASTGARAGEVLRGRAAGLRR
jgi:N-acyl-D-aspartate/D-glutamate deacylase